MRVLFVSLLSLLVACGPTQTAPAMPQCPATPAAPSPSPAPVSVKPPPAPIDTSFLRTYAATRGFRLGTPKNATPTPDGKAVLFLRSGARDPKQSLFETDLETGNTKVLLAPDALMITGPEILSPEEKARRERLRITATGFTAFDVSDDGSKVLLSFSGGLFVHNRKDGKTTSLPAEKGAAIDPHFSPDGQRVAYVRDNDLRSVPLDAKGKEVTITKGGTEAIPHGLAEFAAQEEFGRLRGFWWSPDSKSILYEEADQSKVEQLTIVDPAHPEKAPDRPYYPRAGKTNADVKLGIVAAAGGKTTWVDWDRKTYPYVAHVVWSKHARPVVYVMDRLQRRAQLLSIDPANGKTSLLVEEKDDAWVNLDSSCPKFLPDGTFLWSSERTGQWQLGLHGKDGVLIRPITKATFGYRELLAIDAEKKIAYVAASPLPTKRFTFAVPLEGEPTQLTQGLTFQRFGNGQNVYVTYEGDEDGARKYLARSVDGKLKRDIPSVAENPPPSKIEWATAGAEQMHVAIVRPKTFDPKRKYPLIDAAYGGPHVVVVTADGSSYAREQWMADALDAIVVKIDAKGTPFRGRGWERAIKDAFDRIPIDGHVDAIKALGEKYKEIDLDRVGVFGWSFGGYFSALALLKHGEVYKAGVVGAPVVDWRDYDTAYTERYLGLPQDNAAVYDAADVALWAKRAIANDAPARPMLIFHGTADDNVYFLNSLKLTEALTKSGRPFEFVPLPGQTHQLSSAAANEIVWGRSVEFLRARL
jgi:dipeptidyl-peptidase 4